jgi:tetratricopeptide (TPR) repeat protein
MVYITAPFLFAASYPVSSWATREIGPLAAASALLIAYLCDCLMNAFNNPIYSVVAGGLVCAVSSRPYHPGMMRDQERENCLPQRNHRRASHERSKSKRGTAEPDTRSGGFSSSPSLTAREQLALRYIELARAIGPQRHPDKAKRAWTHAMELLTEAASAAPDNPGTRELRWDCVNDFAWFLLHVPDADHETVLLALHLATQATENQPESGAYWNTLGNAQYRAGNFGAAIMALERSIDLNSGGMGGDYLLMAMAHAREGRPQEARDTYDRAALWIEQNHPDDLELLALRKEADALLNPGDLMTATSPGG